MRDTVPVRVKHTSTVDAFVFPSIETTFSGFGMRWKGPPVLRALAPTGCTDVNIKRSTSIE